MSGTNIVYWGDRIYFMKFSTVLDTKEGDVYAFTKLGVVDCRKHTHLEISWTLTSCSTISRGFVDLVALVFLAFASTRGTQLARSPADQIPGKDLTKFVSLKDWWSIECTLQ